MAANDVPIAVQHPLLISCLEQLVLHKISQLGIPPTYQELMDLLARLYESLEITAAEHARKFYECVQESNQTVQEYVTQLKIVAARAFPDGTPDAVATHLFGQLRKSLNSQLRSAAQPILSNGANGLGDQSLTQAIEILQRMEKELGIEVKVSDRPTGRTVLRKPAAAAAAAIVEPPVFQPASSDLKIAALEAQLKEMKIENSQKEIQWKCVVV